MDGHTGDVLGLCAGTDGPDCWMAEINGDVNYDIGTVLAVLGYSDGIPRLRFSD